NHEPQVSTLADRLLLLFALHVSPELSTPLEHCPTSPQKGSFSGHCLRRASTFVFATRSSRRSPRRSSSSACARQPFSCSVCGALLQQRVDASDARSFIITAGPSIARSLHLSRLVVDVVCCGATF